MKKIILIIFFLVATIFSVSLIFNRLNPGMQGYLAGQANLLNHGFIKNFNPPDKQTPFLFDYYQGAYDLSQLIPGGNHLLASFCQRVNEIFPQRSWNQCYLHLGTAVNYHHLKAKAVFSSPSFAICEDLGQELRATGDCVSGLYNGLNKAYLDGLFEPPTTNHFDLCDQAPNGDYRLRCYRGLVHSLYRLSGNDPVSASFKMDYLEPEDLRFETWLTFFSSLIYENIDYQSMAEICNQFEGDKQLACITGYATGIVEVAANGQEDEEIVAFCSQPQFTPSQEGECYRRGFADLVATYPDQGNSICLASVPTEYQSYCQFNKPLSLP